MGELWFRRVAVWGRSDMGQLWCVVVVVFGSCGGYPYFIGFSAFSAKNCSKNSLRLNLLPQLILQWAIEEIISRKLFSRQNWPNPITNPNSDQ